MFKKQITTIGAVILLSLPVLCFAESYGARSFGMGGVGVASSHYDAASGNNPALLTRFAEDDDFSLRLLAIGAEVSDQDDVLDSLDDISDTFDLLEEQIDFNDVQGALESKDSILKDLSDISNKPIRLNAGADISIAKPSKSFAWAVDVKASLEAGAIGIYDPNDEAVINAAIISGDSDVLDNIQSFGLGIGALVIDASVSMAREFKAGNYRYSLSVSPKLQRVETFLYVARANDFDSDDIDSSDYRKDDSNFNIDFGGAFWLTDNINFGLVVRDLIAEDYDTVEFRGQSTSYEIEPTATIGAAYANYGFTAAIDVDLIKREPFKELDSTQFARVGFEYDMAEWFQLRTGYRYDIEETRADVVTAGLGISPFDVLHIDVSGLYGEDDTMGGSLELKFTF